MIGMAYVLPLCLLLSRILAISPHLLALLVSILSSLLFPLPNIAICSPPPQVASGVVICRLVLPPSITPIPQL